MSQTQAYFLDEDLQCSTDDEDDDEEEDFQEVSEDENNAASILDQGERMHAPQDTMVDYIDPKNIKTEVDVEAQQLADESMDVDPNYDPSDFLAMHKPRENLGEPTNLQGAFSNFLQDETSSYNAPEASTSAAAAAAGVGMSLPSQDDDSVAMQMPPEMPTTRLNNGLGIDDDLDISESDEEDDGTRVRIKKEVLDDSEFPMQPNQHHFQQLGPPIGQQSQIYVVDSPNGPPTLDYQHPPQLDYSQHSLGMEQLQQLQQVIAQPTEQLQQQPQQTPQGDNDYAWTF